MRKHCVTSVNQLMRCAPQARVRIQTHAHLTTTHTYTGGIIVKTVYKAGKNLQSQAERNKEIIKGTISVNKEVYYSVKAEVLRSDLDRDNELLERVTFDGKQMLPAAGCNPSGNDDDCDFWTCPDVSATGVFSTTGSIAVGLDLKEHSQDCDCDIKTWQVVNPSPKAKPNPKAKPKPKPNPNPNPHPTVFTGEQSVGSRCHGGGGALHSYAAARYVQNQRSGRGARHSAPFPPACLPACLPQCHACRQLRIWTGADLNGILC